jgi:hypothetical protein
MRAGALLTCGAGLLFLVSSLLRFNAGFSIPLGLPILFVIAWTTYHQQEEPGGGEDEAPEESEDPARGQ